MLGGAVCTVHRQQSWAQPWISINRLQCPVPFARISAEGTGIAGQRNECVKNALARDVAWVLFIDDDHVFAEDCLERLLAHGDGYPIIGGLYVTRPGPTHHVTALRMRRNDVTGEDDWLPLPLAECDSGEVVPVDGIGMGFTLIRRPVFDALGPEWFQDDARRLEDIPFCVRAKAAGFQAYCDTSLRIPHLTVQSVVYLGEGRCAYVAPHLAAQHAAALGRRTLVGV